MAINNSLTTRATQKAGITAYLTQDAVKNQINSVIGGKNGTRFISSIVSAVNTNPNLAECTNQSILSGALLGESLNLSPSPQLGHYYLIPFNDKNVGKVAQFQLGYKGYVQLAIRSGQYKTINVIEVKKDEFISYDIFDEEIHLNKNAYVDYKTREEAETVGYYGVFELVNGFRKTIYWSKEKMELHALKYSAGYRAKKGFTFWEKDFDSMAKKTLLRQLLSKWGIMSIEMQKAFESDMAYIDENGKNNYVDNDDSVIEVEAKDDVSAALFGNE